jgi:hypothetical protein
MTLLEAIESNSDVIVLLDSGGFVTGNFQLRENQWLLGGGDTGEISIQLPWGEQLDLVGLGTRPQIVGTPDPVFATSPITLAAANRLQGVAIEGGSSGIAAFAANNIAIVDTIIENAEFHGIELLDSDNAMIRGIVINNIQIFSGIRAQFSDNVLIENAVITATGTSLVNVTQTGIDVSNSNNVILDNIVVNGVDEIGVQVNTADTVRLNNITVVSPRRAGMWIVADEVSVSDVGVTDAGEDGIRVWANLADLNRANVSNVGENGLILRTYSPDDPMTASISNVVIDTASVGISFWALNDISATGLSNQVQNVTQVCTTTGTGIISGALVVNGSTCP